LNPRFTALLENARRLAGVFLLSATLGGCAMLLPQTSELRNAKPADLPDHAELKEVPYFPQDDYQCGPASLAMVLATFKPGITPEQLVDQVYLPGRQGSLQVEMLASARRNGLVAYQLAPRFDHLLREVAAGVPVVVLQDYGVWPVSIWHYAVVVGYDFPGSRVIMRSGELERVEMPFAILELTWKDSDYWAMVAVPPDRIPATANEQSYLAAVSALERIGNTQAARTAYTTALGRWPKNITARVGLANTHYALGELAMSEAVLRLGVEQQPDSVILLNNLAQTLSDLDRNKEALSFADQAVALGGRFAASVRETRELILQRLEKKKADAPPPASTPRKSRSARATKP
jgi:hypothetical protein